MTNGGRAVSIGVLGEIQGKIKNQPRATIRAGACIGQLIGIADAPDALVGTYARDTRLDLANAESITATRFDDVIITPSR